MPRYGASTNSGNRWSIAHRSFVNKTLLVLDVIHYSQLISKANFNRKFMAKNDVQEDTEINLRLMQSNGLLE